MYPEVKSAYFVYVDHEDKRSFIYRSAEENETNILFNVVSKTTESKNAELLSIYNTGVPYKLDFAVQFYGKRINKIGMGLCWIDR